VQPAVANDERLRRVDAEVAGRAIDEAAARLAAVALPPIRLDLGVGMVRTIVIRIDARASWCEERVEVAVDVLDEPFGEIAAGHTCLVCRHHDAETGPIEEADGVDRPRIHRDAADALEIPDVFDE